MNLDLLRKTSAMLPSSEKERLAGFIDLDFVSTKETSDNLTVAKGLGLVSATRSRNEEINGLTFNLQKGHQKQATKGGNGLCDHSLGNPSNPFYGATTVN